MAKESAKAAAAVLEAAKNEQIDEPQSAPTSPVKKKRGKSEQKADRDESPALSDTVPRSQSAQGKPLRSLSRSGGGMKTEAMGKEHRALMAEDQIQAMWRGQNERLLRLLEEEEVREAERDAAIKAVQYEMMERQRLERQFDKERQDARDRIVTMTKEHERVLLARMNEL